MSGTTTITNNNNKSVDVQSSSFHHHHHDCCHKLDVVSSPFHNDCLFHCGIKNAVITGGGSGIGYEISKQLLFHGCKSIMIVGRRESFLQSAIQTLQKELAEEEETRRRTESQHQQQQQSSSTTQRRQQQQQPIISYCVCDVRNYEQCENVMNMVKRQQRQQFADTNDDDDDDAPYSLDILVNGAAGNFLVESKDLSSNGFKTVLNIDTVGTFNMCKAAYPLLSAAASNRRRTTTSTTSTNEHFSSSSSSSSSLGYDTTTGIIINISATLQYGATYWQIHASAAKSAIDSMTRTLALEWGHPNSGGEAGSSSNGNDNDDSIRHGHRRRRRGIRVVGIAPGPIANTPGTTKLAPGMSVDDTQDMITSGIPLGRMGNAYEIGMAVVYLCSTAGQYITGTTLVVDGGQWLYRQPMVPKELVSELSRKVESKSRSMQVPTTTTTTTTTNNNNTTTNNNNNIRSKL